MGKFRAYFGMYLLGVYSVFGDPKRLSIAKTANVGNALFNVSSGQITIGDYVIFGHNVSVITGTHDYHKTGSERLRSTPSSGRDVVIKRGAWIASNVTILGPCTIGENAVIGACCLITRDVPPNTLCKQSGASMIIRKLDIEGV